MRKLAAQVALVLVAVLSPPAAAEAAPVDVGTRTKTVHREYGDWPVRLGNADHVEVRFHGSRGDRVRLAGARGCPVSLRGPDGVRVTRQPDGFWRLTDRGGHTFALTRCSMLVGDSTVQLTKLIVGRAVTDGAGLRLRGGRGYVDAVRVQVPASGRLQLRGQNTPGGGRLFFEGMLLPDGTNFRVGGLGPLNDPYFFEAGRKISGRYGPLRGGGGDGSLRVEAGDRVLVLTSGSGTVWTSKAENVAMTIDGPVVTLPPSEVPYREYGLEFQGQAGTWVNAEITGPTGEAGEGPRLLGPQGHQFEGSRHWLLRTTGTYRLMVPTAPTTLSTQVRLRTIAESSTPVPADGSPVTLTTDGPGRWLLAPLTLERRGYVLTLHSAVASGGWSVMATVRGELHCARLSMGCGDSSSGVVGPLTTTSAGFGGYGPDWVVLLRPDPGVSASVVVSVAPQ